MKSLTTKGAKDWEADSWIYQREPRSAALGSDDGSQCFHHSDWVCFAVRNLDGNAQFCVLKPTNNVEGFVGRRTQKQDIIWNK
jgi:hypothetical protein